MFTVKQKFRNGIRRGSTTKGKHSFGYSMVTSYSGAGERSWGKSASGRRGFGYAACRL